VREYPDGTPLKPSEKSILAYIARHHNLKSNDAWPSLKTLGRLTCISDRHARRITRRLEQGGLLRIDYAYRADGEGQTTNRYYFTCLTAEAIAAMHAEWKRKAEHPNHIRKVPRILPRMSEPSQIPVPPSGPPRLTPRAISSASPDNRVLEPLPTVSGQDSLKELKGKYKSRACAREAGQPVRTASHSQLPDQTQFIHRPEPIAVQTPPAPTPTPPPPEPPSVPPRLLNLQTTRAAWPGIATSVTDPVDRDALLAARLWALEKGVVILVAQDQAALKASLDQWRSKLGCAWIERFGIRQSVSFYP
jgi:hypothetical protein